MATTLVMNKRLLLISDDGVQWTLIANVTTEGEIDEVKSKLPAGVHMLTADRLQLDVKEETEDAEQGKN